MFPGLHGLQEPAGDDAASRKAADDNQIMELFHELGFDLVNSWNLSSKINIAEFLDENNVISSCQDGFIKGRSCLTNLLESLEQWTTALDKGYGVDVLYLG